MNICFVSTSLGLGGVEHMVSFLGNEFSINNNVYYYSLERQKPFWTITKPNNIFFRSKTPFLYIRVFDKLNKYIDLLTNDGKLSIVKYQKDILKDILNIILKKKINTLFLTSAPQIALIQIIKKHFPSIKIIAWIHESSNSICKIADDFWDEFYQGLKLADAIVCLTNDSRTFFSSINSNTFIIHNPCVLENNLTLPNFNNKNVLFVSRLFFGNGEKGLDLLVNIIEKLPKDITVTIIGNGSRIDKQRLRNLIKNKKIEGKVSYLGAKRDSELVDQYLHSSLYISTSRTEGFGLGMLDALSLGVPVISFKTQGAKEILDNGKYGILVNDYDTASFADNIMKLINDKDKLLNYQRISLKRARLFSSKFIFNQWINLVTRI